MKKFNDQESDIIFEDKEFDIEVRIDDKSILNIIDPFNEPFIGEFFSIEDASKALTLVKDKKVNIITKNLDEKFIGIYAKIDSLDSIIIEVSLIINLLDDKKWVVKGDSKGRSFNKNDFHVFAVLLQLLVQENIITSDDLKLRLDNIKVNNDTNVITILTKDVRMGILYLDDSDSKSVLENMSIIRYEGEDFKIKFKLKKMGLKPIVEIYAWDEIKPEYRDCYAYHTIRQGIQEIFWSNFISNEKSKLESLGCNVNIDSSFNLEIVEPVKFYSEIKEEDSQNSTNWFEFEYGVEIEGKKVNILPGIINYLESRPSNSTILPFIESEMARGVDKVTLKVDSFEKYVSIPFSKLKTILSFLTEIFDPNFLNSNGKIRVHKISAANLINNEKENKNDEFVNSDSLNSYLECFNEFNDQVGNKDNYNNKDFLATLRPYQSDGVRWLNFLRKHNLGGILADDMGLGKTIQTLYHLHSEKCSGRVKLPSLIVAPKSVIYNWVKEAKKFAPSLKVLLLQGSNRKKYYNILQYCDLVVISYSVLLRDSDNILNEKFHYVILDEAHTIKNASSRISKVSYELNSNHKLCLSGTPIENNLGELWSLFNFLMPGFLGTEKGFNMSFRKAIEKDRDEGLRKRLVNRVSPLMLRRTKNVVARDLPPKTEIIRSIELTPKQINLYEAVRASVSKDINDEISRIGLVKSQIFVLDALMKLRQVCNHPKILNINSAKNINDSSKMDLLLQMIPTMIDNGRKVLIFSQFTKMIDLIEEAFKSLGIDFISLTGRSKDRGGLCTKFQSGLVPVFLISLRAGGTGLNLTEADTVIHFDPWWNPALESQATDRAYRIGQKNPVFVYKFITKGTIEEKILTLQNKKRMLFDGIIEGTPQKPLFSENEIANLLSPIKL